MKNNEIVEVIIGNILKLHCREEILENILEPV